MSSVRSCSAEIWKDFLIKRIENEDVPQVLESLRKNFLVDEVANDLFGSGSSEDRIYDIEVVVIKAITEGLSFMVVDKTSGRVAGVQIMYINYAGKPELYKSFVPRSPISHMMRRALDLDIDICGQFGVSEYAYIGYTFVDRDYREQGIGYELWIRSINLCKDKRVSILSSFCTGPGSQKIAIKLGFQEIKRKYYVEVVQENPNGNFTRKPSLDEFMSEMILKLSFE